MNGGAKKETEKKRLKKKTKKKERGGKKVERSLQAVGTSPMNDATYARVYVYRLSKWIVPMRCYALVHPWLLLPRCF